MASLLDDLSLSFDGISCQLSSNQRHQRDELKARYQEVSPVAPGIYGFRRKTHKAVALTCKHATTQTTALNRNPKFNSIFQHKGMSEFQTLLQLTRVLITLFAYVLLTYI